MLIIYIKIWLSVCISQLRFLEYEINISYPHISQNVLKVLKILKFELISRKLNFLTKFI